MQSENSCLLLLKRFKRLKNNENPRNIKSYNQSINYVSFNFTLHQHKECRCMNFPVLSLQKITGQENVRFSEHGTPCLSFTPAMNMNEESTRMKSISEFFLSLGSTLKEFFRFRWYSCTKMKIKLMKFETNQCNIATLSTAKKEV